ncbi:hypothetical protein FRX31_012286 [Thalictrum thalictroides]|uniref:Uncharacterized protein n=1 Tax=Thalictrum thalictroides TaxID=46969 RepID=A0A7J6WMF7_THATH|nr:hypothetical protein FRX31_012286 [Thalictrum thalictroides]
MSNSFQYDNFAEAVRHRIRKFGSVYVCGSISSLSPNYCSQIFRSVSSIKPSLLLRSHISDSQIKMCGFQINRSLAKEVMV